MPELGGQRKNLPEWDARPRKVPQFGAGGMNLGENVHVGIVHIVRGMLVEMSGIARVEEWMERRGSEPGCGSHVKALYTRAKEAECA